MRADAARKDFGSGFKNICHETGFLQLRCANQKFGKGALLTFFQAQEIFLMPLPQLLTRTAASARMGRYDGAVV
jgi:hypothetical protein